MSSQFPKLILLPGMDGTGNLYTNFIKALPDVFETEVLRYPADHFLSYEQLVRVIEPVASSGEPFVLVAESFSTPLAILLAATKPPTLKGVVICAGFIKSPVRGWRRLLCSLLSPVMFHCALPESVTKYLLAGRNASPSLLLALRTAVSSVRPRVLSARLQAILTCDARAELEQVTVPMLYLQAKHDRLVEDSCFKEIQRIRPKTPVAVISGPHLLFQSEPQKTVDCVIQFVQKLVQ